MQGVKGYLEDQDDAKGAKISKLSRHWGSLDKSLWTLVGAVTGGVDWMDVAEPITELGALYVMFFLAYIGFVLFGLLNILNGVFVNAALQASATNRELAVNE